MHRAWAIVVGLLAAPLVMVLTAAPAHACSCAGTPFATQVAEAGAVFSGTVTVDGTTDGPVTSSAQQVRWSVAVDAVHRGDVGPRATVLAATGEASCGVGFLPGVRYLVVGEVGYDGSVSTGLCAGTAVHASLTGADLAVLGAGRPVVAPPEVLDPAPVAPSAAPDGAPGARPSGPLVLGGAALLLLTALGVAVVRRRRT